MKKTTSKTTAKTAKKKESVNSTSGDRHKLLHFNYENEAARYCKISNYKSEWKLSIGQRIDDFPGDVTFQMNDNFKDFIGRNDFLHTTMEYLVVQQRVREFFEAKQIPDLQFLPVVLRDHRGRKVPETFWLINFVNHVDCIDKKRSKIVWDKDCIEEVQKVVLKPETLERVLLTRTKYLPDLLVVADSLAKEMKSKGFTGFEILKVSDYEE